MEQNTEIVVFGGGCFWCIEAVFKMIKGVVSVMPGYAGGSMNNPSYEQVCSGSTGHAEVVRIEYDPSFISFRDLLTVFFASHDSTTLNRQGNDIGTQYRSIVLYTTQAQKNQAEQFVAELNKEESTPVVTEINPLETFWPAEEYHRDYFTRNPEKAYCQIVINPKIKKLQKEFDQILKDNYK